MSIQLPLDCIGVIISFLSSPKIVCNLLLVNKRVKNYIENEHPRCCMNVRFVLNHRPKRKIGFVTYGFAEEINNLSAKDFSYFFPNMFKLEISKSSILKKNERMDCSIFKYLPLEELFIDRHETILDDLKFYGISKTLKKLRIRKLLFRNVLYIYELCETVLENLETLELEEIYLRQPKGKGNILFPSLIKLSLKFCQFSSDRVRNLFFSSFSQRGLKKLRIEENQKINSSIFQHVGWSLESLELIFPSKYTDFGLKGLEYLKKLKFLRVVKNTSIREDNSPSKEMWRFAGKETLRSYFGNQPLVFSYSEKIDYGRSDV